MDIESTSTLQTRRKRVSIYDSVIVAAEAGRAMETPQQMAVVLWLGLLGSYDGRDWYRMAEID